MCWLQVHIYIIPLLAPALQDQAVRCWVASGGSAGIGRATALAFDKNGCKVAIVGRRKERLDAVVSNFSPIHLSHTPLQMLLQAHMHAIAACWLHSFAFVQRAFNRASSAGDGGSKRVTIGSC